MNKIIEECEIFFNRFGLKWDKVENKLIDAGLEYMVNDIMIYEKKDIGSHPIQMVYFAAVSIILKNVKNILEIGTWSGIASHDLSKLFPQSTIYTIDIPETDPDYSTSANFRGNKTGLSTEERKLIFEKNISPNNVKFMATNSFFLPSLDLPEKFDIIFVDGDHTYPQVAGDIMFAYNHIKSGGFLFMHDCRVVSGKPSNDVSRTIYWIKNRIKEEVIMLLECWERRADKMALIVKG